MFERTVWIDVGGILTYPKPTRGKPYHLRPANPSKLENGKYTGSIGDFLGYGCLLDLNKWWTHEDEDARRART